MTITIDKQTFFLLLVFRLNNENSKVIIKFLDDYSNDIIVLKVYIL